MSIFPTTRLGRALVIAGLVTVVAVVVPFLVGVVRMVGDEATELPPLTPAGTRTTFLLANPVVWFLAVTAVVYVVLWILQGIVRVFSPAPPPRSRPRPRPAARPAAAAMRQPARPRTGTTARRTPATAKKKAAAPRKKAAAARKKAAAPAKKAAPARKTTSRR